MTKNIVLAAVSVFVMSLATITREVAAQDASSEMTPSAESLSAPELDIPAVQDVQNEKFPSLVVSATRYETPQNRVSSDITVITKEDIAHLPVHDVAEVLNYITGVSIDRGGGPGAASSLSVQGSNFNHVKVMIDEIPIESLSSSFPDTSLLDLNSVERIEVLKGAASSVWGSSIGGVINIVTRKPSETFTSEAGVSAGENSTRRFQASISGKSGAGYYLSAKRFETDGFNENQMAQNSNFYGKVTKDITSSLKIEGSYEYVDINREDSGWSIWMGGKVVEDTTDRRGRVVLVYSPDNSIDVSLNGYFRGMDFSYTDNTGAKFAIDNEVTYGGGLRSVWRHSADGTFSSGVEASRGNIVKYIWFSPETDYSVNKKAVYANEVLSISDLTLNLGIRYDNDSVYGSEASPSAGIVYRAGKETIFRVNAARGFIPPPITSRYWGTNPNTDLHAERAWTYQAGVEQNILDLLSGKLTLYRADITDLVACDNTSCQNLSKVKREGYEVDLKTKVYNGFSLSYGYAFNDVRNVETDKIIEGQVRVTHNIGVDYRAPYDTRLNLQGHYIYWNAASTNNAKEQNFLWDAKVSKYLAKWKSVMGELFVSLHNISDQDQYWLDSYPNPGRWIEAGVSISSF